MRKVVLYHLMPLDGFAHQDGVAGRVGPASRGAGRRSDTSAEDPRARGKIGDLVNRRRTALLGDVIGVLVTGSAVSCSYEPSSRGERGFMVGDVTRAQDGGRDRDDAVDAGEREDPQHPRGGGQ